MADPAETSAKRQPGDTGGRIDAGRREQAERLGLAVSLAQCFNSREGARFSVVMVLSGEAHPFPVCAGSPSIGQAAYSEKALIRRVQPFQSLECLCPLNPDRHPATRERDLERSKS